MIGPMILLAQIGPICASVISMMPVSTVAVVIISAAPNLSVVTSEDLLQNGPHSTVWADSVREAEPAETTTIHGTASRTISVARASEAIQAHAIESRFSSDPDERAVSISEVGEWNAPGTAAIYANGSAVFKSAVQAKIMQNAAATSAASTPMITAAITTPTAASATPAQAANMKLVFEDTFSGTSLDITKWYPGPKPNGGQWGGAYLVPAGDPAFTDAYSVSNGVLRLRARYDANYKDPQGYGRNWRGAELSTAFPDGTSSTAIRKGYFEARMKIPAGEGAWAAWWMLNVPGILKKPGYPGDVEIDALESYGQWVNHGGYLITFHDYGGNANVQFHSDAMTSALDLSTDFHDYGVLYTGTEVATFFDGKEVCRAPLPKAATVGKFFALLDMNIDDDSGRKVTVPASKTYDLFVQHVRVWSAD